MENSGCYSIKERGHEVEYELLEKLVMIFHAKPYWLFNPESQFF